MYRYIHIPYRYHIDMYSYSYSILNLCNLYLIILRKFILLYSEYDIAHSHSTCDMITPSCINLNVGEIPIIIFIMKATNSNHSELLANK